MNKIKMLEKMFPYQVTYLAGKPGEAGAKPYTQKVFAGNENDAASVFNGWFISSKAFPDGSSCRIQKIELIQSEGFQWRSKKAEAYDGWDGWEECKGLEDAILGVENLAYELHNGVRGILTNCKNWAELSKHIEGLASDLADAAKLMAYKRDEDRRLTDTFRIQYLDEFDPEFSGKEVRIKGTGTDRRSAEKDAIKKFYDEHPDAEIHAVK